MNTAEPVFSLSNININIKYALTAEHDNSWYEVKAKAEYALWIIQKGSLTIEYKQNKYTLYEGDAFFFYPQVLYHATSSEYCCFIFIHFNAISGTNYQALHFYPFDGFYPFCKTSSHLTSLVTSIDALRQKELFAEFSIQGSLMVLLSHIMKLSYQENAQNLIPLPKSALARLQPVLIYINHHLAEPIYIEELAHSIHLSEKYFITFFKKTMGVTPIHYITEVKMKKALEYLHEQNYSIKEVASLLGYIDIYTFSKAFKKVYGVSPSKF